MNKKILIFGAGGFVGRYLAQEFCSHGYKVFGTDIVSLTSHNNNIHEYTCMDMLDMQSVMNLIAHAEPDYIINLAAVSSVGNSWNIPQKTIEVNVNGTLNILESVRQLALKTKILLIGSSEEYAISDKPIDENYMLNANNPYGISKITQEHFANIYRDIYGMNIISTRTFNHTGIGQPDNFVLPSFVKQAADIHNSGHAGTIYAGNLKVKRDIGDVRDMASAYRLILESNTDKTILNVGSGNCYSLEELLEYVISLASQKIEIIISKEKLRPADNPIIWCDNSRLRSETGWTPRYTVYDAIKSMFTAIISQ